MDPDQQRAMDTGCGCRCSWCGNKETLGKSHCGRVGTGCFKSAKSIADARKEMNS